MYKLIIATGVNQLDKAVDAINEDHQTIITTMERGGQFLLIVDEPTKKEKKNVL